MHHRYAEILNRLLHFVCFFRYANSVLKLDGQSKQHLSLLFNEAHEIFILVNVAK